MTVEITPSGSAKLIAQQLLAVAETDPRFTIDDVKTTTSGPMGLAFLVPEELHEAWVEANVPRADSGEETEGVAAPRRGRGRPRKTDSPEE